MAINLLIIRERKNLQLNMASKWVQAKSEKLGEVTRWVEQLTVFWSEQSQLS
jgi:hypothetical protein